MKNFLNDIRGNIAMTAALVLLPVMVAGGMAVDYAGLSRNEKQLQGAVDAALLAVGSGHAHENLGQQKAYAKEFLKANLSEEHYSRITKIELSEKEDGEVLELTAFAEYPATLMRLAGYENLEYTPTAAIRMAGEDFEIVLVLDSTYSMSQDSKMDDLKVAAKKFVNELMAFNNPADPRVRIGLVPFAQYANVGLSSRGASWLDVEPDRTEEICYKSRPVISKSGCHNETRYNDGVPYQAEVCSNKTYGEEVETCYTASYEWKGCVGSRVYPLNLQDKNYGTRVPGLINTSCSEPITPLTDNQATLEVAIDALVPSGETYIPAGLAWGLRVLSSNTPYTEGLSYPQALSDNTRKVVVLMTDGDNQKSAQLPGSPHHWGDDLNEANKWTEQACDEIKDNDITVFTISFGSSVSGQAKKILKKCASADENFIAANGGLGITAAFDEIAARLSALYLAR